MMTKETAITNGDKKRLFNKRSFVVFAAVLTGLGLPITGYMNHVYQLGKMDLHRHAWMSAHNGLAVLFIVMVVWHIVLNRRTFLTHFKNSATRLVERRGELLVALLTVMVVLFVFVGHAFIAN